MKQLVIEAQRDKLNEVLEFLDEVLESSDCSVKIQMQMDIAVEEIFINIASYAYAPGTGQAEIMVDVDEEKKEISVRFTDSGIPYNPLEKEDPDVTLSAEERSIGGLGIYMVKKSMDDMIYSYEDGKNILTIIKKM